MAQTKQRQKWNVGQRKIERAHMQGMAERERKKRQRVTGRRAEEITNGDNYSRYHQGDVENDKSRLNSRRRDNMPECREDNSRCPIREGERAFHEVVS